MQEQSRTNRGKTILWTVGTTLMVLVLIFVIVPFTGAVDVAATRPHLPAVGWYLETTQEQSVAARAADVEVPRDLSSPARVERGLVAYQQMCAGCHGAPGQERGWIGRGLNPEPPALWQGENGDGDENRAAEHYVVIDQGIRMTGMPALEPTHDDEEIWDLVAFVEHLPEMTPEAYASAVHESGLTLESAHEHEHGGGHEHGGAESHEMGHAEHHEPGAEHETHHHDEAG